MIPHDAITVVCHEFLGYVCLIFHSSIWLHQMILPILTNKKEEQGFQLTQALSKIMLLISICFQICVFHPKERWIREEIDIVSTSKTKTFKTGRGNQFYNKVICHIIML